MEPPAQAITLAYGDATCYLPLAGMVDLAEERMRLEKELANLDSQIARSEGLLGGAFAQRAPKDVVQRERDKLAELKTTRATLHARLTALSD